MYYLLSFIGFILAKVSNRYLEIFADFLSWFGYDLLRMRRKIIASNLATALPGRSASERQDIGRRCYRSFILTAFEFLRAKHVDMVGPIEFEGQNILKGALASGDGVYVLCIHMGNWEAMAAAVSRLIVPSRVVVKEVGSKGVDRFVNEVRRENGFYSIKRTKSGDGYRKILQTLKNGEIVGFVMDQYRPGEPEIPLFGKPAKTNTSFAQIWLKRPRPIIPGIAIRGRLGEHRIKFFDPIQFQPSGKSSEDVLALTRVFNSCLEKMILTCPEQYFWLHNRWKTSLDH